MAREIYRIKFGHFKTQDGINACRIYTLGMTGDVDGEYLTPQKITIKDKTVKVIFEELGIQHVFTMDDKTEVYYRDKVKKDANKTTD